MQRFAQAALLLVSLVVVLPAAGARADYYSYTKENGTLGYTDELKRVPARYRASAVRHADQPLGQYSRFTKTLAPAAPKSAPAFAQPGTPLGGAPVELSAPVRSYSAPVEDHPVVIEIAPGAYVRIPEHGNTPNSESEDLDCRMGDEDKCVQQPIQVTRRQYRWIDGQYRPFTIVKRGDRVISEIEDDR